MSSKVEEIRDRWSDTRWPKIGYFVHGQAKEDIRDLLKEVDRLTNRREPSGFFSRFRGED